jgi:L-arabinose isomerase
MQKLRVGYAGVAIASYFAEEHHQYERAINGLEALSQKWGFELVPIRQGLLNGEMAEQAARELTDQKIDFLLLENAACSMGEQLVPLSKAAPRLGLWATPDPKQEGEIRIHSVVSMSQYASILKRYLRHQDVPFKWFYGHVEEARFQNRLGITIRALTAIKNMAQAKIGWIGGLSPGFYDMIFDERKLQARFGTRVFAHELGEVVALAKRVEENKVLALAGEMKAAAAEVQVTDEAMGRGGRVYYALKELAERNGYAALAVECWPKFQTLYGVAPCLAYSWLGSEDGMAVACEGDVQGAMSMLLLNYLTGKKGSATLLDMTALDPDAGSMLMWHCGVSPRHFANADGIKWVNHTTLGRKGVGGPYGVSGDQVFGAQETTVTYVGDSADTLLVLRSQIVERDVKGFDGTRGWFSQFELNQEPIDLWDLLNTLTVRGHEHHYAVGQGNVTNELLEVAAWLKMRTIDKVPYRDYLQIEGVNV